MLNRHQTCWTVNLPNQMMPGNNWENRDNEKKANNNTNPRNHHL